MICIFFFFYENENLDHIPLKNAPSILPRVKKSKKEKGDTWVQITSETLNT